MSINNKRSYTEYTVVQPTTDFAIGFDDFDEGGKDNILVTLNGVLVESLGYAAIRKNESTVTITPAITEGTVRLTRETDIDEPFHKFTAGALFSAKSMDENFQQVRHSQQEVRDGFVFLEHNTNGIVQASKEATLQAKAATVEATASAVRAESAADTAVQAVGTLQGVVNAATTATTKANTATATANTAASQATAATTSAQNAAQAATVAQQEATAATANAKAATVDTLAATGRADEAANVVADLVVGKVRAQDVSTADGSTQDFKNTEFRTELDALPAFQDGKLSSSFVTTEFPSATASQRSLQSKVLDSINILDFQKRNDRDFTDAFEAAINSQPTKNGFVINVPSGTFKLTRPIFITGSIEIKGEGMGNTVLDFSEATSKLNAPYSCAIMFPYYSNIAGGEYTTVPDPVVMPPIYTTRGGINGKLTNLTVKGKGKTHSDTDFNGVFINTPSNLDKVEVKEFSGHGFVLAANVSDAGYGGGYTYGGNANHSQLTYCQAFLNGKDGLRIIGSDANSFVVNQCLFPVNGGWGVFDHSLLGGLVMGCEADGNGKGSYGGSGYDGVPITPSRTLWLSNYSEGSSTPVHYAVNSRNTILGGTGAAAGAGQPILGRMTDMGFFADGGLYVASDERQAIDLGGTTERASRLLKGKLEMRTGINRDIFSMGTGYTDDYIEFLVGNVNGITIPTTNITDSILKGVPWFPLGITLSQTCHVTAADAAPTTGYHRRGEYVYNAKPTAGGYAGWVCVEAGASGVWKGFGAIEV